MSGFAILANDTTGRAEVRWDVAVLLAEISAAVYEESSPQIAAITRLGATTVTPVLKGSAEGVVASDHDSMVIAFRGTKGFADIITDIKIFGQAIGGGKMHGGFLRSVDALFDDVAKAARNQNGRNKKIWITGHSLGGAMAAAYAYRLLTEKSIRACGVMTFGQPLVMTTVPAQLLLDEFQSDYVRFVNSWDCVSRMLPNYRHTGARVHLTEDSYSLRAPMIAFSASPENSTGNVKPSFMYDEVEDEVQLMTEEELNTLEAQLKNQTQPLRVGRVGAPVMSAASWLDPFVPHYMSTYLPRLRMMASKHAV